MNKGLLLINLGTPDSTNVSAVRRYLRGFLTDKRVIDLPWFFRYLLVYAVILPFRPQKSARAYEAIWTKEGSPLLTHSKTLIKDLQATLGSQYKIALGMRYGNPSIEEALDQLKTCESITVLPLYPQYSSAATGSAIEELMRLLANQDVIPSVRIIRDFYQNTAYLKAQAQRIRAGLGDQDHLLLSYHGVPERQMVKSGCSIACQETCPPISQMNQGCYKAQCHETSRLLARALMRNENQYSTTFQSRLGKTPWIKPYTDEVLIQLAAKGVQHLTIACPSFVTDCLETLEEIGIRAQAQWLALGGKQFTLIPCLNNDPLWIDAITNLVDSPSS